MKKQLIDKLKLIARKGLIVMNDGFLCLSVKKGQMIFESFNGKDINDNPLAIYQQLIKNKPELAEKMYFSVKPSEYRRLKAEHPNIRIIKRFTPQWVSIIARAQFWVMNSRMPTWWKKNKQTTYIQTWHGTPLKKLGIDISNVEIPGQTTASYHADFSKEASRWNYLIAPNQYSENIFTRAFNFKNRYLEIGYPRNDVLYQENNAPAIKTLKQRILGKIPKRIIMYAPTWRDDDFIQQGKYHFTLPFDLNQFFKQVDNDTILIIRPHYLVADQIDISGFEGRVFVIPNHDINELYLITDLLITDYSSVMFDYANLKRPMLFFAYDLPHYKDKLRGFYFPYDQQYLPGPLVTQTQDFYQKIASWHRTGINQVYSQKLAEFNQQFCSWDDGHAAQQVSNLIQEVIKGEDHG